LRYTILGTMLPPVPTHTSHAAARAPAPVAAATPPQLARMLGTADLAFTAIGIAVVFSGVPAFYWWRRSTRASRSPLP
jgi:hypothetical protein